MSRILIPPKWSNVVYKIVSRQWSRFTYFSYMTWWDNFWSWNDLRIYNHMTHVTWVYSSWLQRMNTVYASCSIVSLKSGSVHSSEAKEPINWSQENFKKPFRKRIPFDDINKNQWRKSNSEIGIFSNRLTELFFIERPCWNDSRYEVWYFIKLNVMMHRQFIFPLSNGSKKSIEHILIENSLS